MQPFIQPPSRISNFVVEIYLSDILFAWKMYALFFTSWLLQSEAFLFSFLLLAGVDMINNEAVEYRLLHVPLPTNWVHTYQHKSTGRCCNDVNRAYQVKTEVIRIIRAVSRIRKTIVIISLAKLLAVNPMTLWNENRITPATWRIMTELHSCKDQRATLRRLYSTNHLLCLLYFYREEVKGSVNCKNKQC